ncbi:MAG TPA: Maf family protein [Rhodocyclaceae bacterium]|nr:Maf family protein [Rhodocyclaceae bacterium]
MEPRIYLASRSPRRRELLHQIGVRFDLLLFRGPPREDAETGEDSQAGEAPEDYVRRIALAKARHGAGLIYLRKLTDRPVLAADTTLDLDGGIIGKPADDDDAIAILRRLSGRSHRVLTAVALARGQEAESVTSISEVRFRTLDDTEIRHYVASGEPHDKAGAYGLQGRAAAFIEEVRGSPSAIVGLPLCETTLLLRRFGYPI